MLQAIIKQAADVHLLDYQPWIPLLADLAGIVQHYCWDVLDFETQALSAVRKQFEISNTFDNDYALKNMPRTGYLGTDNPLADQWALNVFELGREKAGGRHYEGPGFYWIVALKGALFQGFFVYECIRPHCLLAPYSICSCGRRLLKSDLDHAI